MRIPCESIKPGMDVVWGEQTLTVASVVWVRNGGGILTFTNGRQTSISKVGTITIRSEP